MTTSLFSERRESEARLARSNMKLQQERNNMLMNIEAIAGAIAQPLAAITANGMRDCAGSPGRPRISTKRGRP